MIVALRSLRRSFLHFHSRELFLSNLVLLTCIFKHNLRKDKGSSSPGTFIGENKTYKLKRYMGSRSLSNDAGDNRENWKKTRFISAKQELCTWVTLFCTFLSCRCTTARWNFLISRSRWAQRKNFLFPFLNLDTVLLSRLRAGNFLSPEILVL